MPPFLTGCVFLTSFRPRDLVQTAFEEPKEGEKDGEGMGGRNGRGWKKGVRDGWKGLEGRERRNKRRGTGFRSSVLSFHPSESIMLALNVLTGGIDFVLSDNDNDFFFFNFYPCQCSTSSMLIPSKSNKT